MIDPLGDRMKGFYENRTRLYLPRRTFTIIRLDGKAFHSLTRDCKRPFDEAFARVMNNTAFQTASGVDGCCFGYVQSDEISLLLTDFATPTTEAWFNGNLQKIVSISASLATYAFNEQWNHPDFKAKALFDSRAFTIPDPVEVANYFLWRQRDCTRNSVSMAAQSVYSHAELHGRSTDAMQEMLFQKGINWNDYPARFKRGGMLRKMTEKSDVSWTAKDGTTQEAKGVERQVWKIESPPIFTIDIFFDLIESLRTRSSLV